MNVALFVEGHSTNVRGKEHYISGFVVFTTVGYFTTSCDQGTELEFEQAQKKKIEIEAAQPKLAVTIMPK